jgi:hypothetical protein
MRKLPTLAAAVCLLATIAAAQIDPIGIIIRLIFRRGPQTRVIPNVHRVIHPDQKSELPKVEAVSVAQKCENWAWAAGLETSLRLQGVKLPQNYWVMKANGGEVCDDRPVNLEKISRIIDGKYVLDDGRKVILESTVITGAPAAVDPLVMAVRAGRPLVFLWKGHPYLYTGMAYHEVIYATGLRDFEVQEIKLLDPFAPAGKQAVSFKPATDDPAEINGLLDIRAIPIEPQSWLHPERELEKPQDIYFPKK